jgi:hypothetical protein
MGRPLKLGGPDEISEEKESPSSEEADEFNDLLGTNDIKELIDREELTLTEVTDWCQENGVSQRQTISLLHRALSRLP